MRNAMIALCFLPGLALALPPLSDNDRVSAALMDARIADEIQSACDAISTRDIALIIEVTKLQRYVKSLGYSNDDIDDYMGSKSERRRIYGMADAYMAGKGVTKGNDASYCALGQAEIAADSRIGSLLRER